IFGEDPNWGRILAAVGYAGVDVPVDNVDIMIGGLPVMLASSPVAFDDEEMKDIMHVDEVIITVDLHAGHEKGTAWGCDLSYDYVKINALYHT
ncbi:MAG: bifunctional ornithine acetyltransferase/N-acetylglutamate synthase, partial [Streptococcus sp.]|nr:bifunctional ornithine acetyltransferase/N-acetylglutamate synthase [Streptococcus sp.]